MVIRAGVVLAGFSLGVGLAWAQTQGSTANAAPADARQKAAEEAREEAIVDRYLTAVQGELVGKVDSQNAKVGQEVAVRTSQDARLANNTELPKGTILHGRVTQVHAQGQQSAGAMMALTFDQAEVKGGKMIPVHCVIQAVNPIKPIPGADRLAMANRPTGMGGGMAETRGPSGVPSIGTDAGPMGTGVGRVGIQPRTGVAPMGSGVPMDGGGGMGGTGVGGGTAGGPMGTGVGGVGTDTTGGMGGTTVGSAGGIGTATPVDQLPASVVGNAPAGSFGVAPVRQAGVDLSATVIPTGFPGLLLSNKRTGGASGVLMETGHNITLDGGTRITLGVITR